MECKLFFDFFKRFILTLRRKHTLDGKRLFIDGDMVLGGN